MEPSVLSLLPPLLAIGTALLFRQVLPALFLGVFSGALLLTQGNALSALLRTADHFIVPALADPDHATIVIFSIALGGLVGIISSNGGTMGLVDLLRRRSRSARSGQFATYLLGLAIFFDDYANTLIVGNTMRPLTDAVRVSREKLAFLVDTTSAPVAALTLSTWIGYEVGLIGDALNTNGIPGSGFTVFITSMSARFYPILMLIFTGLLIWLQRDFGPMWQAETRARRTGQLLRPGASPAMETDDYLAGTQTSSWLYAALPIAVVVISTLTGLYLTGYAALKATEPHSLMNILGAAASGKALLWGTMAGCLTAIGHSIIGKKLTLNETLAAWGKGTKSMVLAMIILILAWSIGAVTQEVGTAKFLIGLLGDSLSPQWIAPCVFILAALTSFATGTSWGTMAILMPIVVPLFVAAATLTGTTDIVLSPHFLATVSAVLAGSIFGDHCSPISDTTVMSSMSASCDHIDHVRTQLPYASIVALVSVALGYLPLAMGVPPGMCLALGIAVLYVVIRMLGRPVEQAN